MDRPITDVESVDEPLSFDPSTTDGTSVTIDHFNGQAVVRDFHFIEHLDYMDELTNECIRVWYSDPVDDDSDYVDYYGATITEVSP